jgi:hypothetical protein
LVKKAERMNLAMRQFQRRSVLNRLCTLGVFFGKLLAIAGEVTFINIGTVEAHQAIWSKRAEIDKTIAGSPKTTAKAKDQVLQLVSELDEIKRHLHDSIASPKGEFETTAEWQSRLTETNKLYHASLLRDADGHEARIKELRNQIDNQGKIQKSARKQLIGLADEVVFFVPVAMGAYDADTGSVQDFGLENYNEVKGHPSLLELKVGYGERYLYEYDGIKQFAGIRVERERARKMREASSSHELWARFTAEPKPLEFAYGYYETNVSHAEVVSSGGLKVGGIETDGPKTVGARLLVSLLGGNPGAIDNLDQPKTRTYTSDDWIKARIIRTGWKGRPNLESFYRIDRNTGRLQPIE